MPCGNDSLCYPPAVQLRGTACSQYNRMASGTAYDEVPLDMWPYSYV